MDNSSRNSIPPFITSSETKTYKDGVSASTSQHGFIKRTGCIYKTKVKLADFLKRQNINLNIFILFILIPTVVNQAIYIK